MNCVTCRYDWHWNNVINLAEVWDLQEALHFREMGVTASTLEQPFFHSQSLMYFHMSSHEFLSFQGYTDTHKHVQTLDILWKAWPASNPKNTNNVHWLRTESTFLCVFHPPPKCYSSTCCCSRPPQGLLHKQICLPPPHMHTFVHL